METIQLDQPADIATGWRDALGITASIACAIHCAAMPFVIGFLPTLGLTFLAGEAFHQWMAGICFVIAATAFAPGWRKHRSLAPLALGAVGLALVTSTAFLFADTCCPPIATDDATAGATTQVCTESCCQDGDPASEIEDPVESGINGSFSRVIVASLTPLGGILLVMGHLLNHRLSCNCVCCGTAPTELSNRTNAAKEQSL